MHRGVDEPDAQGRRVADRAEVKSSDRGGIMEYVGRWITKSYTF